MKIKTIITGTAGIGFLAGGLYLLKPDEYKHEPVKILRNTTTQRTQDTLSPFGDPKIFGTQHYNSSSLGNKIEEITNFLDKNPAVKQRIQSTSWYRDFLSGRLTKDIFDQYITNAITIEQKLSENPGILQKIQHEGWWKRYIMGETNPIDMLVGNMQALITLQKIEQEQPEFYNSAQKSPLWNKGIQQGEDYIVAGQREIITSLTLRVKQLDEDPNTEEQIKKFGFSRKNLFTDDWSQSQGIYSVIDIVREINELNVERKEEFFSSNLGKEYLSGKIDLNDIEKYLHGE